MDIIITSPSLNPQENVSGISTVTSFIIRNNTAQHYLHFQLGRKDNERGGWHRGLALVRRYQCWKDLLRTHPQALIHYNFPLSKASLLRDPWFMGYALRHRRKMVVHVHGGFFLMAQHIPKLPRLILKWVFRHDVPFIVLSENEKHILESRFGARSVSVLPNAVDLKDAELRLVLNRVLDAYNDYLILTYADQKLPEDRLSIIDLDRMDILESLEQMQTASDALNNYCQSQSDEVKAYRSWKTGFNLNDWMEFLQMLREVNIDYLYSYVYTNGYVKNKSTMLMNYQYQLRNEQSNLDQINSNIQTLDSILKDYKKDNIFVSMQESGTSRSTSTTTDYFNQLIMDQVTNYSTVAQTETRISNLNDQIEMLSTSDSSSNLANVAENINTELVRALEASRNIYSQIKAHMEEVQASPEFTHFAVHTAASGEQKNFLSANLTKMIIGFVLGGVIGCGLWFMASLLPELTRSHSRKESKKEADA